MKNAIIAAMTTYIFWTDICVVHSAPAVVVPLIWLTFWLCIWAADEEIKDWKRRLRGGKRLQRSIRRMVREATDTMGRKEEWF